MKRLVALMGCAALTLLGPRSAGAEVRLTVGSHDRVEVRVRASQLGVWAPVGPMDDAVLNADGDRLGDASPALAQRGSSRVAVAWTRAGSGDVHLAFGTERGWESHALGLSANSVGTPVLMGEGVASTVVWREHADDSGWATAVALVDDQGRVLAEPTRLEGTQLVSAWLREGHVLLLVLEPSADGAELVLFRGPNEPIEPIEFERFHLAALSVPSNGTPLLTGRSELGNRQGDREALYWWTSGHELGIVELDVETGAPFGTPRVFEDENGRPFSPSLLNKALHELR